MAAAPSIQSTVCEVAPVPPFPVAGGRGATNGATVGVAVDVGATVGVAVDVGATVGVAVDVGATVGVAVGATVAVDVTVVVAETVGVAGGAAATRFETVAVQRTSEPPPLPEELHCWMLMGSVEVIVDAGSMLQVNSTVVPPLPEPVHCPTVTSVTLRAPLFAGVQCNTAVPVVSEPPH
jgi:hypothetical protein